MPQNWNRFVVELKHKLDSDPLFNHANEKSNILNIYLESSYLKEIGKWFKINFKTSGAKDSNMGFKLRLVGNHHFTSKYLWKALEYYNKAIIEFEYLNKEDAFNLALAHGNRSATFYELKEYQASIVDIYVAFNLEKQLNFIIPCETKLKYIWRMLQCSKKLNLPKLFNEIRTKIIKYLNNKIQMPKLKAKYEKLLEIESLKSISTTHQLKPTNKDFPFCDLDPTTLWKQMGTSTFISTKMSLAQNSTFGRYFIANEKIEGGDIVLLDKSYVAVPIAPSSTQNLTSYRCHQCYLQTSAFISCAFCTSVVYCSSKCKLQSWSTFHRYECGYIDNLNQAGATHHTLRIMLKAGLLNALEMKHYTKEKRAELLLPNALEIPNEIKTMAGLPFKPQDYAEHYRWICGLTYTPFEHKIEDLLFMTGASLVYQFLKKVGFCDPRNDIVKARLKTICDQKLKNPEFKYQSLDDSVIPNFSEHSVSESKAMSPLCKALDLNQLPNGSRVGLEPVSLERRLTSRAYLHLYQVYANSFMSHMYPLHVENGKESQQSSNLVSCDFKLERIASCLFPLASIFNHSCKPNVYADFVSDVMLVKATEQIDKGQQLFITYGPVYGGRPYDSRQQRLKSQYGFDCRCLGCEDPRNREFERDREAFRCAYCQGPVRYPSSIQCNKCGYPQDQTQMQSNQKYYFGLMYLDEIFNVENPFKDPEAIAVLPKLLRLAQNHLYAPDHNLAAADLYDVYSRFYVEKGDVKKALQFALRKANVSKNLYGNHSINYVLELSAFLTLVHDLTNSSCSLKNFSMKTAEGKEINIRHLQIMAGVALKIFQSHITVENIVCREAIRNLQYFKTFST